MPQQAANKKGMNQQATGKGNMQQDMNDTSRSSNQGRKAASGGTKETNKQGNRKGK